MAASGRNEEQFEFRKGEEVRRLYEPTFKDALYDLVTSNREVSFFELREPGDEGDPDAIGCLLLWRRLGGKKMRKSLLRTWLLTAAVVVVAYAKKDRSNDYQIGTFVSQDSVDAGTSTDTTYCVPNGLGSSVTCSGGWSRDSFPVYAIRVEEGIWTLQDCNETIDRDVSKTMGKSIFHRVKSTPLDRLRYGDKVLFRVEMRRKIGGRETHILVPFADKPEKESDFLASFLPRNPPPVPVPPVPDNVKAMCDSHRLSPEAEARICGQK